MTQGTLSTDPHNHDGAHDHGGSGRLVRALAPFAALAATWAVRKAITTTYSKVTGSTPPAIDDPDVAFRRAILWAVTTASAAAVVEVAVQRFANRR